MVKTAIITGGDSGIGAATAVALSDAGFDVAVTWNTNEAGAEDICAAIRGNGRRAICAHLDLQDTERLAKIIDELVAGLAGIGVLVNSAAIDHRCDALTENPSRWSSVLAINLTGSFLCAQRAAQHMVDQGHGGRIVNVTSIHEHAPLYRGAAYCASKAALGAVTKVMALELARHAITVNAVAPGHVATPMTGYPTPAGRGLPESAVPLTRIGQPAEIAAAIRYLCSDATSYITGISHVVDGGVLLMGAIALQRAVDESASAAFQSAADI